LKEDEANRFETHLKKENQKLLYICNSISRLGLTPKKFIVGFLLDSLIKLAVRRGFWGTNARWTSKLEVLKAIKHTMTKKKVGRSLWRDFILSKVSLPISFLIVKEYYL
jgi:hypothetical protein